MTPRNISGDRSQAARLKPADVVNAPSHMIGWHGIEWWLFNRVIPFVGLVSVVWQAVSRLRHGRRGVALAGSAESITQDSLAISGGQARGLSATQEWRHAFLGWVSVVLLLVFGFTFVLYAPIVVWVSGGSLTTSLTIADILALSAVIGGLLMARGRMVRLSKTPGGTAFLLYRKRSRP